jgi:Putative Flp pilus-assembly TadE/G-like
MRSLIRSRLRRDDAGATLAIVSIMMVVLLGMGALVLDVGQLYVERRELQNGADAGALAVAQDCAGGDCRDETTTARTYANDNAHDGKAAIGEVCGSGPGLTPCASPPANVPATGWVKVKTVTPSDDKVDFVFAPILGHDSGTANATAVAAWGGVGKATTIPVAFSVCEFKAMGGTIDGSQFPTTRGYIYVHKDTNAPDHSCPVTSSGQNLPGGFSWLDQTGTCKVAVTAGGMVGSDTGTPFPNGCNAVDWRNAEVLIPLFDQTVGSGNTGEYRIIGFAAFKVLGYKFNSNDEWNLPSSNHKCPDTTGNSGTCLYGEFTRFVTMAGQIGGGTDFGARVIQMIG